jgi:hypothetical protein
MASEQIRNTVSIKATASLATKQFSFVKLDSNGQVVIGTSGAYCIGVLQDKPAAGDPASVCLPGNITKVFCGGSFNAGGDVASDTNGAAVAATSGAYVLGQAISAGVASFEAMIVFQPKGSKM